MKAKSQMAALTASVMLLTALFSGAASADSVTVTADKLNIRQEANASSKAVSIVRKNDELSFVSESGDWYQVREDDKTGFVMKEYVALDLMELEEDVLTNTEAFAQSLTGVTAERVNMRELPITDSAIVKVVSKKSEVEVIGQCGVWYQVNYGGKTGYLMAQYLTLDEEETSSGAASGESAGSSADDSANGAIGAADYASPVTGVATARVNMRAAASTGSSVVKVIGYGGSVSVLGESGGWYKVSSGSKSGYIMKDYIRLAASDSGSASGEVIYDEPVTGTATARVNMRASMSTDASIVKVIGKNQKVTIEGETSGWYKVTSGGREGYIVKTYLRVESSTTGDSSTSGGTVSYPAARAGTTTARVNMRKAASTGAGIAKVLADGASVTVLGEQNGFYQVKYGSTTGYIAMAYVKLGAVSSENQNNSIDETIYSETKTGVAKVTVNMRAEPEGNVLHTLPADTKVTLIGESGSWYKAVYSNTTGYISKAYVNVVTEGSGSADVSGSGTTAYVTANSLNLRKGPGTGYGVVKVLSYGDAVQYYSLSDGWYLVKAGEDTGYVSAGYISTEKPTGGSDGSAGIGKVILSDWFKGEVADVFARGDIATVTDVKTGLSFAVKRTGGYYHADAQPLTTGDTEIMHKVYSYKWDWARRSIWVTVDGKTYAASMNGMPHGETDTVPDNDFDGCFCIHFLNSKTHEGNRVDSAHQACVQEAYKAG